MIRKDQLTLQELREGQHLTQKELASLFGVSSQTIYNVEQDSSHINNKGSGAKL